MLNGKVFDICASYSYLRCPQCPLHSTCDVPHENIPGDTIAEKTEAWEASMNKAAEEVEM